MKQTILWLALAASTVAFSQVGLGTQNPQQFFHVDGAKDNPTSGSPSAAEQLNDFTVTNAGRVGIGTTSPVGRLHVVGTDVRDFTFERFVNGQFLSNNLTLRKSSSNTIGTNAAVPNGHYIGKLVFQSNTGSGYGTWGGAEIGAEQVGLSSTLNQGSKLYFATSPQNAGDVSPLTRMVITADGNVGIGTTIPTESLQVNGQINATRIYTTTTGAPNTGNIWQGTSNLNGVEMTADFIGIQRGDANLWLTHPSGTPSGNIFVTFALNGAQIGTITQNGTTAVAYNTTSDSRLKENIKESSFGLKDLLKVKVVDYNYKKDPNDIKNGFLAQQLEQIYPFAVTKGGDDPNINPWSVDYGKITPLLVKAIQDQQKQIEELKAEVKQLKTKK